MAAIVDPHVQALPCRCQFFLFYLFFGKGRLICLAYFNTLFNTFYLARCEARLYDTFAVAPVFDIAVIFQPFFPTKF
jgi:hypothetical protein